MFALGCGSEPRIDTSSDAAMETSIEEVRSVLSSEEQERFDEALQVLAFSGVTESEIRREPLGAGGVGAWRRDEDRSPTPREGVMPPGSCLKAVDGLGLR